MMKNRKRFIDIKKMSPEQVDNLSAQIGNKISEIMDEANKKCNEILNIYGLETQIMFEVIEKKEQNANSKSKMVKTK